MIVSTPADENFDLPRSVNNIGNFYDWLAHQYNSSPRWLKDVDQERQPLQAHCEGFSVEDDSYFCTYLPFTALVFDAFCNGLEGTDVDYSTNTNPDMIRNYEYGKQLRVKLLESP